MRGTIEKRIYLPKEQARRLEELAWTSGATESALVEEAIDLLLREKEKQAAQEDDRQAVAGYPGTRILPEESIFVVGTTVPPERLVHAEEPC